MDRAASLRPVHWQNVYVVLSAVKRAAHAMTAAVQHMGVDHRRVHVFVAQEPRDGADVAAGFEQVSGERMPERVAACVLGDPGLTNGDGDALGVRPTATGTRRARSDTCDLVGC
jgi:hypothetical protein